MSRGSAHTPYDEPAELHQLDRYASGAHQLAREDEEHARKKGETVDAGIEGETAFLTGDMKEGVFLSEYENLPNRISYIRLG